MPVVPRVKRRRSQFFELTFACKLLATVDPRLHVEGFPPASDVGEMPTYTGVAGPVVRLDKRKLRASDLISSSKREARVSLLSPAIFLSILCDA